MSTQKPFKWSNVILIALLVIVVLIPMLMSRPGKNVDTWTRATDVQRTIKKLEGLDKLEALEGMPELQAELDSILREIDIPELDSLTFIIPELTIIDNGEKIKQISISKASGLPSFEVPPKIIGGYDSILEHLVYPEKLKEAGIEGTVIVQVHVKADGSVGKTHLLLGSGYDLFDRAALEAAMKIKFKPIQPDGGKALSVWVALPVFFKLSQ